MSEIKNIHDPAHKVYVIVKDGNIKFHDEAYDWSVTQDNVEKFYTFEDRKNHKFLADNPDDLDDPVSENAKEKHFDLSAEDNANSHWTVTQEDGGYTIVNVATGVELNRDYGSIGELWTLDDV